MDLQLSLQRCVNLLASPLVIECFPCSAICIHSFLYILKPKLLTSFNQNCGILALTTIYSKNVKFDQSARQVDSQASDNNSPKNSARASSGKLSTAAFNCSILASAFCWAVLSYKCTWNCSLALSFPRCASAAFLSFS